MTSPMDATEEGEQNNLKQNNMHEIAMNHEMGFKLTLEISKQEFRRHNHGIIIMPTLS
jgi:hypothetical protein